MKLKAVVFTLAAFALVLNNIGCADGGRGKNRIASRPVVQKPTDDKAKDATGTDTKDGQKDTPVAPGDKTPDAQNPDDKTPDNTLPKSTYDQAEADKIDDSYENSILANTKVIDKAQLAGKKLVLKQITMKLSSLASSTKEDSVSAIVAFDVSVDAKNEIALDNSKTIAKKMTGSAEGIKLLSIPAALQPQFNSKGKIEGTSDISGIQLNVILDDSGLNLSEEEVSDKGILLESATEIVTQLSDAKDDGTLTFSSQVGKSGVALILEGKDGITIVIEVELNAHTIQTFALSYSVDSAAPAIDDRSDQKSQ